jgi:acyl carrier protein
MGQTAPEINTQADATDIVELVCLQLRQSVPATNDTQLDEDTRLLEGGLLDSLGILQLTLFLGDSLGLEIEDEDFVPENFGTVGDLARFVLRKRGQVA